MVDIVREIEITAALSSDYQAAFNAAASIAKSTSADLAKLTKREADLAKMTELAGQAAAASAASDAKAVERLQKEYDKLADKLGLVDKSAAGVAAEIARVGASRKEIEALNASASKSAEMGRLARDIQSYTTAAERVKDPALTAALDRMKKRFKDLGGVIPDKKKPAGFFSTLRDGLVNTPGPISSVVRSLSVVRDAFKTTGGKAALIVGGLSAVAVAAAKVAKAMWDLGVDTVRAGDQIAKTSRQLGIDAEAYQEFAYAVGLGGASEKDFDIALRQLNKQMEAAQGGNSKAIKAFKELGISMAEVKSLNTEEMFMRISDGLSQVDDAASKTRTTMTLFGEQGNKVATAIAGGSAELDKLREEARAAGYVLNNDSLKKAEQANDDLTRAQLQLRGAARQIGVEVMPTVNEVLQEFIKLIRDNRAEIADFAQALGTGFQFAGYLAINTIKAVNVAVHSLVEGVKFWGEVFSAVGETVSTKAGQFVDFIKSIPGIVMDTAKHIFSTVETWFGNAKARVSAWISDVVNSVVSAIMEKLDWLTSALRDVPLIGGLFDDAPGSNIARNVVVNINNSVDARGAQPGAAAAVQRAVSSVVPASGERAAAVLAEYNGLTYAGAAR